MTVVLRGRCRIKLYVYIYISLYTLRGIIVTVIIIIIIVTCYLVAVYLVDDISFANGSARVPRFARFFCRSDFTDKSHRRNRLHTPHRSVIRVARPARPSLLFQTNMQCPPCTHATHIRKRAVEIASSKTLAVVFSSSEPGQGVKRFRKP